MRKIVTLLLILILTSVSVFATNDYEILTDADFEEANDEVWVKYVKAYIDFSEDAFEGTSALLSSERTHNTDVVKQFVQDELNYYGTGKYTAQAQVKLAEADAEPIEIQLVVNITAEGKTAYVTSGYVSVSGNEWTQISLSKDFKWDGEVTKSEFYFVTKETDDTGYADILIDNCSLVPLEFTGEPFDEETEETPAPTEKPTEKPAEKPQETKAPEENEAATPTPAVSENSGPNKKQSQVIGGMIIACGVILLIGAVALFISYRKDKKNEKA